MCAPARYRGVVVAVDPQRLDASALAVGAALGAALGRCELLSVAPLGARTELIAAHLARAAHRCGTGDVQGVVVQSDDPASAIIEHVGDDRLLVMGCGATHPMRLPNAGDVGRNILGTTSQPVLVVGPGVSTTFDPHAPLIVCAGEDRPPPLVVTAVERWLGSFDNSDTWVTRVVPTSTDVGRCGARTAEHWTEMLRHNDVPAQVRILHGGDPTEWLNDFVAQLPNGVYVASSSRYTDRRRHLHSTTRDLIRRSRHPVLVVPIRAHNAAEVARRMSES